MSHWFEKCLACSLVPNGHIYLLILSGLVLNDTCLLGFTVTNFTGLKFTLHCIGGGGEGGI